MTEGVPPENTTPGAPSGRQGFSFAFKLLLGIIALLGAAGAVALWVVQDLVAQNYRVLLEERFVDLLEQFRETRKAHQDNLINELDGATQTPRLTAAFGVYEREGDHYRFYDDFCEEIETTFRRLDQKRFRSAPFLRFIDYEGRYLKPNAATKEADGIWSPFDEAILEPAFLQLATTYEEQVDAYPRSGYLRLSLPYEESEILSVMVYPVYDNRGYFMGDAIVSYPITGSIEDEAALSGLWISGHLHAATIPLELEPAILKVIESVSSTSNAMSTVSLRGQDHAIFTQPLSVDSRFPHVSQVTLFSLAQQSALVADIRLTILAVAALTLIVTIFLALIFSRQITRSMRLLVGATQQIAKGDFDVRLPVTSTDEIGRLTASFNEMAADLALKERYRSVLDKVTDPSVASALTNGGLELGGEERPVTVLFADIRSFTSITETMQPHQVVAFLNEHMTALTEIVHAHHGVVDKFVGDEIMVLFGAPQDRPDAADLAVHCAQAMIARREALNEISETPARIGIGVATGPVLAGCMGSQDRLNYTVLGPVVNLAARLCSAARPGEVKFDAATHKALREVPNEVSWEQLLIRGFSHKIDTFTLSADGGLDGRPVPNPA